MSNGDEILCKRDNGLWGVASVKSDKRRFHELLKTDNKFTSIEHINRFVTSAYAWDEIVIKEIIDTQDHTKDHL
jgi:hypothetical protein